MAFLNPCCHNFADIVFHPSHSLSWMQCLKNSKHNIHKELCNLRLSINQGFEHPCHPYHLFFDPSLLNMFYRFHFAVWLLCCFAKKGPMLSDVFGKDHHPWQHLFTSRLYLIMQASSIIEKWILTRKKIDCLAVL